MFFWELMIIKKEKKEEEEKGRGRSRYLGNVLL